MQSSRADAAIRAAIDSVFRSSDYNRSLREIILDAIISFIQSVRLAIARMARDEPLVFWITLAVLAILVGIVVWRGAA